MEVTATESLVSLHDQFITQLLQDNELKERTIIHPSILYNTCKNKVRFIYEREHSYTLTYIHTLCT